MDKLISLTRSRQLYVFLVLLVLLPLVMALAFQDRLFQAYLVHFEGPELQKQFGFSASRTRIGTGSGAVSYFAITGVQPDGRLYRAGFRAGDLPVGYEHGAESGFYEQLHWVRRGESALVKVVTAEDLARGEAAWRTLRIEPGSDQ